MPDNSFGVPLSSVYTYHMIFNGVRQSRFIHLIVRFLGIISLIYVIMISLISFKRTFWKEILILSQIRLILIYISGIIILITRKNYIEVDSSNHQFNIIKYFFKQLIKRERLVYLLIYMISSNLMSIVLSDFLRLNEYYLINIINWDGYIQFISISIILPIVYTIYHGLIDIDLLRFEIGVQHILPQENIKKNLIKVMINSIKINFLLIIIEILIFFNKINIKLFIKLIILKNLIIINFEIINLSFTSYMISGCIWKNKPISEISNTPMLTLLDGIKSDKLYVKITAFQDFAYRCMSNDKNLRKPINDTEYKNGYIWNAILEECKKVLDMSNIRVEEFVNMIENTMNRENEELNNNNNNKNKRRIHRGNRRIFGKSGNHIKRRDSINKKKIQSKKSLHHIDNENEMYQIFKNKRMSKNIEELEKRRKLQKYIRSNNVINGSILTSEIPIMNIISDTYNKIKRYMNEQLKIEEGGSNREISIIEAIFINKGRESQRLIPIISMNIDIIIGMSQLMINSLEEDINGSVVSTVGEILNIIKDGIIINGKYVNIDEIKDNQDNRVNEIYEIYVESFIEIVLKYHGLLNDVELDEEVISLVKWVLEMSIST